MKTEMTSVARIFPQTPQEAMTFNAVESETKHMKVLETSVEMQGNDHNAEGDATLTRQAALQERPWRDHQYQQRSCTSEYVDRSDTDLCSTARCLT
jgi:hypothetical protein